MSIQLVIESIPKKKRDNIRPDREKLHGNSPKGLYFFEYNLKWASESLQRLQVCLYGDCRFSTEGFYGKYGKTGNPGHLYGTAAIGAQSCGLYS